MSSMLGPLPLTPLHHIQVPGHRWLYLKDESVMPNGTFKDRLTREAISRFPAASIFSTISYGNTAVSLVRTIEVARSLGLTGAKATIFVPRGFDDWSLGPSSLGTTIAATDLLSELRKRAQVIEIDVAAKVLEASDLRVLAGVDESVELVDLTEGIDVPAYVGVIREAVEQLGRLPDVCLVPYGAGILCNELRDFLAAQSNGGSGCRVVPLSVASATSRARMLYGPVWIDVEQLAREGAAMSRHRSPDRTGARRDPYPVYAVHEDEVMAGLALARQAGISAEPSAAVGLGVLPRLSEFVPGFKPERDTALVINTGNGIEGFLRSRA